MKNRISWILRKPTNLSGKIRFSEVAVEKEKAEPAQSGN